MNKTKTPVDLVAALQLNKVGIKVSGMDPPPRKPVREAIVEPKTVDKQPNAYFVHAAGSSATLAPMVIRLPFDLFKNEKFQSYRSQIAGAPTEDQFRRMLKGCRAAAPLFRSGCVARARLHIADLKAQGDLDAKDVNLTAAPKGRKTATSSSSVQPTSVKHVATRITREHCDFLPQLWHLYATPSRKRRLGSTSSLASARTFPFAMAPPHLRDTTWPFRHRLELQHVALPIKNDPHSYARFVLTDWAYSTARRHGRTEPNEQDQDPSTWRYHFTPEDPSLFDYPSDHENDEFWSRHTAQPIGVKALELPPHVVAAVEESLKPVTRFFANRVRQLAHQRGTDPRTSTEAQRHHTVYAWDKETFACDVFLDLFGTDAVVQASDNSGLVWASHPNGAPAGSLASSIAYKEAMQDAAKMLLDNVRTVDGGIFARLKKLDTDFESQMEELHQKTVIRNLPLSQTDFDKHWNYIHDMTRLYGQASPSQKCLDLIEVFDQFALASGLDNLVIARKLGTIISHRSYVHQEVPQAIAETVVAPDEADLLNDVDDADPASATFDDIDTDDMGVWPFASMDTWDMVKVLGIHAVQPSSLLSVISEGEKQVPVGQSPHA